MIFEQLIRRILGQQKLSINENERVILSRDGKISKVLRAGIHWVPSRDAEFEWHAINMGGVLNSNFEQVLFKSYKTLADEHFIRVRTQKDELKIVYRDEIPAMVLKPDGHQAFWIDAGPFRIEEISLASSLKTDSKIAKRLSNAGLGNKMISHVVPEGYIGLLYFDGELKEKLGSGTHWFWNIGQNMSLQLVDLRLQAYEVNGQEILTKDRVSLRVNITADYRVTDPLKAMHEVQGYREALHRSLQFAFRHTLSAMTLDELLSERVTIDKDAAKTVRNDMAKIGLEIGDIALKDVILPGDMRDILNQVVTAQKEAEANVIRRREETNATRSLLNTAKVMAENPVMLRLKELEALENISSKVERLTVHNGTSGLLSDIAKLSD